MSAPSSLGLSFQITVHPVDPGLPYLEPHKIDWELKLLLLKIVFVVVPLVILLIVVIFAYLLSKNPRSPRQETIDIELQSIRVENHPRIFGSLENIPLITYGQIEDALLYDQRDCPICLEDFVPQETLMIFPSCQHAFHDACATQFLTTRNACPCCRHPVRPDV